MRDDTSIVWRAIGGLFVVFLLSPLALVVLFAFTSRAQSAFPIEALSLHWWGAMFADANFAPAFWNSLVISGTVGILSALVGTMRTESLGDICEPNARHCRTLRATNFPSPYRRNAFGPDPVSPIPCRRPWLRNRSVYAP